MTERLRQAVVGIGAALHTPFWLGDNRLRTLIDVPEPTGGQIEEPRTAVRFALGTIRVLGRMPLLPWRNTCLYRSVAECLVWRRFGVPCRLRIGVRRDAPAPDVIESHAWVERAGVPPPDTSHVPLQPSR